MGCVPVLSAKQKVTACNASILRLGDDILLQILTRLSVDELLVLRKTCKYFYVLSRSRYLWHHALGRDVVQERRPLPSYRKPLHELESAELEILTRRALRLDVPCQQPTITRLDSKQSVQWIRLVHGQWMLVASTGKQGSALTLYSLTDMENGKPSLIAAAGLPGPVSSGDIQVHDDRLVVALCFQSPRRMVQVLSLQKRRGQMEFITLSTFEGLSHIRCMRKELVGCAVYGDTQSPCIANWKTGEVALLPVTPDGPGKCLAMALREDICVVASESSLTVYSTPSNGPCELLQVLQLDHSVGNVSVSAEDETLPLDEVANATQEQQQHASSQSQRQHHDATRMLLFTTSSSGINVLRLREQRAKDVSPALASSTTFSVDILAEEDLKRGDILSSKPSQPHFGGSTSRLAWIYAPTSFLDRSSASLVTARFAPRDSTVASASAPPAPTPTPATPDVAVTVTVPVAAATGPADVVTSSGGAAKLEIMSECKSASLPSFHVMPVLDYDDGAGLVAIGNGCGELVLCNYAGGALGREVVKCFKEVPVPVVEEL